MANVTKKSETKDRTFAMVIMSVSVLFTGITASNALTYEAPAPAPAPVVESASSSTSEVEWISTSEHSKSLGSVSQSIGSVPSK